MNGEKKSQTPMNLADGLYIILQRLEEKLRKLTSKITELEAQQTYSVHRMQLSVDTTRPPPSSFGIPKEKFWASSDIPGK